MVIHTNRFGARALVTAMLTVSFCACGGPERNAWTASPESQVSLEQPTPPEDSFGACKALREGDACKAPGASVSLCQLHPGDRKLYCHPQRSRTPTSAEGTH